jgi:hypothetical protein
MHGNMPLMPKARSGHEPSLYGEHWFARPRTWSSLRSRRRAFLGNAVVMVPNMPERRRRREYVLCDRPRIEAKRKAKAGTGSLG